MEKEKTGLRRDTNKNIQIPDLVSRFFKARGLFDKEDQIDFLTASLKDIGSPFLLNGMDKACARLTQALQVQEKIGIYGDYDMDGSSAVVLLEDAFKKMGFTRVEVYQPRRLREGYGFHKEGVDYFKSLDVSLIVTVDVGITAHETCLYAKKKGLDIILTDHHLPDEKLPEAVALINPNTRACLSGMGHLCGVGVAFYLVYGLAKYLKERESKTLDNFRLADLLDLFVIGTLTDMVPLIKENRALTKAGLKQFSKTKRPGLIALKAKSDLLSKEINSSDIGFKIAPKLNSLSRLDSDLRPVDILREKTRQTAEALVSQAFEVNDQRKELLEEALKEALDYLEKNPPQRLSFYVSKNIHPGVMGLVATRVAEKFGLPAFIGSCLENNMVMGSARLPAKTGLSLKEIMSFCPSLLQYGGHAEAAGFELHFEKIKEFEVQLGLYLEDQEDRDYQAQNEQHYDCEAYLEELGSDFLPWLKNMEPFGVGFETPLFKVSNLKVTGFKVLKDIHYKVFIEDEKGNGFDALWFFTPEDHDLFKLMEEDRHHEHRYNFFVNPQVNFFRGRESMQLLVQDVEVLF